MNEIKKTKYNFSGKKTKLKMSSKEDVVQQMKEREKKQEEARKMRVEYQVDNEIVR